MMFSDYLDNFDRLAAWYERTNLQDHGPRLRTLKRKYEEEHKKRKDYKKTSLSIKRQIEICDRFLLTSEAEADQSKGDILPCVVTTIGIVAFFLFLGFLVKDDLKDPILFWCFLSVPIIATLIGVSYLIYLVIKINRAKTVRAESKRKSWKLQSQLDSMKRQK